MVVDSQPATSRPLNTAQNAENSSQEEILITGSYQDDAERQRREQQQQHQNNNSSQDSELEIVSVQEGRLHPPSPPRYLQAVENHFSRSLLRGIQDVNVMMNNQLRALIIPRYHPPRMPEPGYRGEPGATPEERMRQIQERNRRNAERLLENQTSTTVNQNNDNPQSSNQNKKSKSSKKSSKNNEQQASTSKNNANQEEEGGNSSNSSPMCCPICMDSYKMLFFYKTHSSSNFKIFKL